MRIMEGSMLTHLILLLTAMSLLLLAVLYCHANKVRFLSHPCVLASALFLLGAMAMQFMAEAILELEVEAFFILARNILTALFLLSAAFLMIRFLKLRREPNPTGHFHQFAGLFERVEDTVLIFDADGQIVRIQDRKDHMSRLPEPILHVDQLLPYLQDQGSAGDGSCQFTLPTPSGPVFQACFSPIRNDYGHKIGHTVVLSDITRQRQLLASLEESNSRLMDSNQRLLQEVGLAEQLQNEKQHLVLISEIQSELVTRIDRAIVRIEQMEKGASYGDFPEKDEILQLSDELDAVYGKVREVVRSISPRRGEPVHD